MPHKELKVNKTLWEIYFISRNTFICVFTYDLNIIKKKYKIAKEISALFFEYKLFELGARIKLILYIFNTEPTIILIFIPNFWCDDILKIKTLENIIETKINSKNQKSRSWNISTYISNKFSSIIHKIIINI